MVQNNFIFPVSKIFLVNFSKIFLVFLLIIIFSGCDEKPFKIGLDTLPEGDLISVGYVDTISVEAYTLETTGINSRNHKQSPLGRYTDPVFGEITAEFITEYGRSDSNLFGPNPQTDSIFLDLYYYDFMGDSTAIPKLNVYELTQNISDTISNADISGIFNPVPINISDPYVFADSLKIFRIRLDNAFGEKLLNPEIDRDSMYTDASDTLFKSYYKGLYFSVKNEDAGGGLFYINLAAIGTYGTNIRLYYHNDTIGGQDYIYNILYKNSNDAILDQRLNLFKFNHSTSQIGFLNDTVNQDSVVYLQSLGGTKVKLKIPYLYEVKEEIGNASILKAELILPIIKSDDEDLDSYPLPLKLGLRKIEADGMEGIIQDDPYFLGGSTSASNYFGGRVDGDTIQYSFNIGYYMQDFWNGNQDNYGLSLFVAENTVPLIYNAVDANRVLLSSGSHSNRIKLKITYTLLP
ncbi:MAG: DUF4270 domain-containing protein [Bacteroidales bacterium]|nr:DUF4270 domain-containing protein [Bacteroidales bacterium]